MTSTKMSVHKAGSARAIARQRLHEPVRARSTAKYSLKRARDFSSQSSWGSRVAWRKMSHIISTGAQSGVMGKRVVLWGLGREITHGPWWGDERKRELSVGGE